jgi:hypothetical protein
MPLADVNREQLDAFTEKLGEKYGPENIEPTFSIEYTVLFWYAQLTWDQVSIVYYDWMVGSLSLHRQHTTSLGPLIKFRLPGCLRKTSVLSHQPPSVETSSIGAGPPGIGKGPHHGSAMGYS